MKAFSIYIIDDHTLFLESIEAFLSLQHQYTCIGSSTEIEQAFQDIVRLKQDIIFID